MTMEVELAVALEAVLGASVCDPCYEDDTSNDGCGCGCHRAIERAENNARAVLSRFRSASKPERTVTEHGD